jgi:hypothetical protein
MKTLKLFLLSVLAALEFGWQVIRYALIFASAFFRQRALLGCEMLAMRSQLTFCERQWFCAIHAEGEAWHHCVLEPGDEGGEG